MWHRRSNQKSAGRSDFTGGEQGQPSHSCHEHLAEQGCWKRPQWRRSSRGRVSEEGRSQVGTVRRRSRRVDHRWVRREGGELGGGEITGEQQGPRCGVGGEELDNVGGIAGEVGGPARHGVPLASSCDWHGPCHGSSRRTSSARPSVWSRAVERNGSRQQHGVALGPSRCRLSHGMVAVGHGTELWQAAWHGGLVTGGRLNGRIVGDREEGKRWCRDAEVGWTCGDSGRVGGWSLKG